MFLGNSPQIICGQIIWLIKSSNLNFQLKETPFGLEISFKKRFVQHWDNNRTNFSQHSHHHVPSPPQPEVSPPRHQAQHQVHVPPKASEHQQSLNQHAQFQVPVSTPHKSLEQINKDLRSQLEKAEHEFEAILKNKKELLRRIIIFPLHLNQPKKILNTTLITRKSWITKLKLKIS